MPAKCISAGDQRQTYLSAARAPLPALALGALLMVGVSAHAQSLKDLFEAARTYDAQLLAVQAQAKSVDYRVAAALGLARPSASLTGSATTARVDPPVGSGGDNNAVNITASARYPIINRSNDATIAQARKSQELALADLEAAEQDLIVRLSQAYFDVLAAKDTLATLQANKTAITEQLASAKRNFEVGTATITDTREVQARFDKATADEIVATNELRIRGIALDQLVGRNDISPRPLAAPVILPPVVPDAVDTWVNAAVDQHPAVRKARIALEVARLETEKARAAEKYTLDAVGSLSGTRASGNTLSGFGGQTRTASVGLQFSMPLYTGGQTDNRIRETLLLTEKSSQDLEAARRQVSQGTRQSFFGVQSGLAQAKALEAAESSSKLALEATQLGYKVGVRVNLDVLNAQTQLFQTRRDLAKARYDVLMGGLRLRQASGQLAPADLNAINALLQR